MTTEVTPGPGGDVLWAWGNAFRWRHRIDAWEPPRLLRLVQDVPERFDADGNAVEDRSTGEPMAVEVTLAARAGSSTLTLREALPGRARGVGLSRRNIFAARTYSSTMASRSDSRR